MTNKGDLISRSALKEEMVRGCRRIGEAMGVVLPTLAFVNIIDNAPTIDPFERVGAICNENCGVHISHGKWIECTKSGMPLTEYGRMMGEKWYGFKCSRCKYIYKGNALVESPYCQECGAKMDGGEEE